MATRSKTTKTKLTLKQELFCKLYISQEIFGNGTQAYIEAYNIDITEKGAYAVARAGASENLTKPNIIDRINELLEEQGLNDQFVDKQLLFLIQQHADLNAKKGAIQEYNKLKSRIVDKAEITHKGIQIVIGEDPDPDYIAWKKEQLKKKLKGNDSGDR